MWNGNDVPIDSFFCRFLNKFIPIRFYIGKAVGNIISPVHSGCSIGSKRIFVKREFGFTRR